jgi:hypothetical protein
MCCLDSKFARVREKLHQTKRLVRLYETIVILVVLEPHPDFANASLARWGRVVEELLSGHGRIEGSASRTARGNMV